MFKNTILAAAVLVIGSVSAAVAGVQDFSLVNRTGYDINEVYVSPSASTDWEEDVLGDDLLANGQTVNIGFSRASTACEWDLKVIYTDGEEAVWDNFDLCTVSKITIRYDRNSGETSAEYE